MSHFEFLSRCYRDDCEEVRSLLEKWYSRYPKNERHELKARMMAGDVNFRSAFWELYLYILLNQLSLSVEIHPDIDTEEDTLPDFVAATEDGEEVIVEAVVATKRKEESLAVSNRKQTVLETIDRLDHPSFYVGIKEEGEPTKSPSGRKLRSKIESWLDQLDYEDCQRLVNAGRFDELPKFRVEVEQWNIEIMAIPKPRKRLGEPNERLIHMETGFQWVDSRTSIRDAIRRKASKYGDISTPFVVAVNAVDSFLDDIDIAEALFGKEVVRVAFGPGDEIQQHLSREPDGAWTSPTGPRNTRISAVLIGHNISYANVARSKVELYHNPWAQRPYKGVLNRMPHYVPRSDTMEKIEGIQAGELFGLLPS